MTQAQGNHGYLLKFLKKLYGIARLQEHKMAEDGHEMEDEFVLMTSLHFPSGLPEERFTLRRKFDFKFV